MIGHTGYVPDVSSTLPQAQLCVEPWENAWGDAGKHFISEFLHLEYFLYIICCLFIRGSNPRLGVKLRRSVEDNVADEQQARPLWEGAVWQPAGGRVGLIPTAVFV